MDGAKWDAVVVGAGVAGGVASAMLAERGWRVLLVEKSAWPREKVCGGCLTAAAAAVLAEIGIDAPLRRALPIDSVHWHAGGKTLRLEIPGERALLRADLDREIVSEAIRRGCEFLPGAAAMLLPSSGDEDFRMVRLRTGDGVETIRAGVVLACDGIGGTLLAGEDWAKWRIAPDAWIGVGATCGAAPWPIDAGEIHMYVGNSGYVGMVRMNEAELHLAAALDPAICRNLGGPENLVRQILAESGREVARHWEMPKIRGTGALTRRRDQLGGNRVLAIGDACGYVEPFTGEGMAWAAMGAREVVDLLPRPGSDWPVDLPRRWRRRYQAIVGRKQNWCRGLRPMMRQVALGPLIIGTANALPAIGKWIAAQVAQPRQKEIGNDTHGVIRSA